MGDFVHLHLHSEYSLLESALRVRDIPRLAAECGQKAVALTDSGVMYGAVEFYSACCEAGIKPIIGCELYMTDRSRFDKMSGTFRPYSLVLLCESNEGYKNLTRIVSRSWTDSGSARPCADFELLKMYSEGLIVLSGGLNGYIPRAINAGNFTGAEEHALKLRDIFGTDRFYLELCDHGLDEERAVNSYLYRLSEMHGIKTVAANNVYYPGRQDSKIHEILLSIKNGTTVGEGHASGFETDEYYFKTSEEMESLFGRADVRESLENTVKIAERCSVTFDFDHVYMPKYPFTKGVMPEKYLSDKIEAGLRRRLSKGQIIYDAEFTAERYRQRIDYEFEIVHKMGYCEYYLVVEDFIMFAKSSGIPVGPGRGSGAGSLIAFLIGITDIDPLRFGLLFERFLNPERVSRPDFDVDFCYDRRDEVIAYVKEKYGEDHVSQITTFGTLAARAAVRDVGRALGMSYSDVDVIASMIPKDLGITLDKLLLDKTSHLSMAYESTPNVRKLIDTARAIEGMPRHASTHAAGVVITDIPLDEIVPLAVNGDTLVTQYDMNTVAKLGLVKFDFLGLRYLTIISDTVARIKERESDFDIAMIPMNDEKTMRLIGNGETLGVFQLESAGMRHMMKQLKPESISDITAAIALYRPGPMDSIPEYISRKNGGRAAARYKDERICKILEETYGCIVYQEQVMQIFCAVAGYSLARADIVRGAMAKKKASVLLSERENFIKGAAEGGMTEEDASSLFDDMESFSSYAFNKSHAAAYAVISYQTAYLKCNYMTEFMASLLDSVNTSGGKTSDYIAECERHGIKVSPPDINESAAGYTVTDDGGIRYGLCALKGIGAQQVGELTKERERGGRFRSFYDFAVRVSGPLFGKKQAEVLIKSGAFDSLGTARSRLMASFEEIFDSVNERKQRSVTGQMDMFLQNANLTDGTGTGPNLTDYDYPELPEYPKRKLLELEKQSSGMYFSGHILDDYAYELSIVRHIDISDVLQYADMQGMEGTGESGSSEPKSYWLQSGVVTVLGVIVRRSEKKTKSGSYITFFNLDDGTGELEIVAFTAARERYSALIASDEPIVVTGKLKADAYSKGVNVMLQSASFLKDAANRKAVSLERETANDGQKSPPKDAAKLYLKVDALGSPQYKKARGLIEIFSGSLPVFIYDSETKTYSRFEACGADLSSARLAFELRRLLGEENVVYR